jgi:hypothetical protein
MFNFKILNKLDRGIMFHKRNAYKIDINEIHRQFVIMTTRN